MADVRLTVCGRQYDIHCADGQEAQLHALAALVDEKARTMQGGTEARQMLVAALMLADEAQEARAKLAEAIPAIDTVRGQFGALQARETAALEQVREAAAHAADLTSQLKAAQASPPPTMTAPSPAMTRALDQIADRIEALANKFDQQG